MVSRALTTLADTPQSLGHLASVVGAADREEAIDRIGVADLRTRIRRKSLADEGIVGLAGS